MNSADLKQISNALCSALESATYLLTDFVEGAAEGEFEEIVCDLSQLADELDDEAPGGVLAKKLRSIVANGRARIGLTVEDELRDFWRDLRTDPSLGEALMGELEAAGYAIRKVSP